MYQFCATAQNWYKAQESASYSLRCTLERSISVRYCLRRRTLVGVISKYSSSAITSRPRSMESSYGGTSVSASSEEDERTLVRFLFFVGFTAISSPFDVLPITIPSYTSVAGTM